ncbi:MAG: anti-sigma regulatory factor [Desulfomicrobiaceae bacterium]|nr:anti-sigma regulatory factor [Desulfomicrobiaceae bacterium]
MDAGTWQVASDQDVAMVRQKFRSLAVQAGFRIVDQTKVVTAASELARNMVVHGGGRGEVRCTLMNVGGRSGICIEFEDHGPGIADVEQALQDGFTTGSGLGLGLGGAKRLMDEFAIVSAPGTGTTVRVVKWR